MCNGSSTRTSQGGSIAVLRPTPHQPFFDHRGSKEGWRLLFSNQNGNESASGTQVEFTGIEDLWRVLQGGCRVIIHRDGDISTCFTRLTPTQLRAKPFFSFALGHDSNSVMQLPQRLDIGVGDSGIIGRRVSVMTGSSTHPMTVAEGIIGWN